MIHVYIYAYIYTYIHIHTYIYADYTWGKYEASHGTDTATGRSYTSSLRPHTLEGHTLVA